MGLLPAKPSPGLLQRPTQQRAEIAERIAEGTHVPVVDRHAAARIVLGHRHVVELPVVVEHGVRGSLRHVVDEPAAELVRQREVVRLRALEAVDPSLDLTREKALRPAERLEADRLRIDGVELGQRVDHDFGQLPVGHRVPPGPELLGHLPAHHDTAALLHHEEVGSEQRVVVAEHVRARRVGEALPQPRQRAVFSLHVVGALGDGTEGRPTQDVVDGALAFAVAQQVGQVGVPAAELLHLERPGRRPRCGPSGTPPAAPRRSARRFEPR